MLLFYYFKVFHCDYVGLPELFVIRFTVVGRRLLNGGNIMCIFIRIYLNISVMAFSSGYHSYSFIPRRKLQLHFEQGEIENNQNFWKGNRQGRKLESK